MKKFSFMRLASVLLVAVMLSTCAISGTFAKYTTSASGSASARVAYWGFKTTSITIDDLFATAYKDMPEDTNIATVKSANEDNVIAPGTWNYARFTFSWTESMFTDIAAPEVDYTFDVDLGTMTDTYCEEFIANNPNILWQLNTITPSKGEETESVVEGEWGTWDELTAAIEALEGTGSYKAGELPDAFNANQSYEIVWKWIFDETSEDKEADTVNGDVWDTNSGNHDKTSVVKLTISITATQID